MDKFTILLMCVTCVCAIIEPKPEMEKPTEEKMESPEMESDSTGAKVKRFLSNHNIHHTTPCPPWQQQKIWQPEIKQLQHFVHQPIYKTHEVPKHTIPLFKPQHHHGWQHQQQFGFIKPQYESYQHSAWIPKHQPQVQWNTNSLWQSQIHKPMYHQVQKLGWQTPQLWQQPKIQVVSTPKPFYHHIPQYHSQPMYHHQQQHLGNHYNNLLIKTAVTTDCPPLFQHHQHLFKSPGVVYAPEHQIKYVHEEPEVQLLKIPKPTLQHSAPTYLPPLQHHSLKIPQYHLGLDDCD